MPMKHEPLNLRKAILAFREDFRDRYDTDHPITTTKVGHLLALAEARLQALGLLLGAEPEEVTYLLDKLVWQADLSEDALNAARAEAGLPNPVWSCLNSNKNAYRSTLTELLAGTKFGSRVVESPTQDDGGEEGLGSEGPDKSAPR